METEQFNIRLSGELVSDLDMISNLLKVNKSEWVRTKLAEEVHEEKTKLLIELSALYAKGLVSKKKIAELMGEDIAKQMESTLKTSKATIDAARKYAK